MKGKYLITTDDWFYAPNGEMYKAVWGEVEIVEDTVLGLKTNRNSSNWYAKVGSEDNHIIVAGCQIHYAAKCNKKPHDGEVKTYIAPEKDTTDGSAQKAIMYTRPTNIYIAE
jgi:hypothetical protein